jgi:uncharacterized protein YndB with AHSA1/START domain
VAISFTIEETFDQPPELVFQALTDLDAMRVWMPNLIRLEKVTNGFGKEATEHFEVTGYQPPKRLELFVDGSKGASKRGEYRFVYELRPSNGGTHLVLSGEIGGMGKVMELLGKLFVGPLRKAIAKDLEALKRHLQQ